jgi:type IV secretory pathway protease TraF
MSEDGCIVTTVLMMKAVGALPCEHVMVTVVEVGDHLSVAEVAVTLPVDKAGLHEVVDDLDSWRDKIIIHLFKSSI